MKKNLNTFGWVTAMKYYFNGLSTINQLREQYPLDSPFGAGVHRACNDIEREWENMYGEE